MSMSGIAVNPGISEFYNEIKLRKIHKYVGFKLSDDQKEVIIDEGMCGKQVDTSSKDEDRMYFKQLSDLLQEDEPRYILYDFGFDGKDGRDVKKLAFMYWCSNNCPLKKRMMYASTKEAIKSILTGLSLEFQVNDKDDMDYDEMIKDVMKKN